MTCKQLGDTARVLDKQVNQAITVLSGDLTKAHLVVNTTNVRKVFIYQIVRNFKFGMGISNKGPDCLNPWWTLIWPKMNHLRFIIARAMDLVFI